MSIGNIRTVRWQRCQALGWPRGRRWCDSRSAGGRRPRWGGGRCRSRRGRRCRGGAISDSSKKKKANKAELEELRQKEAEGQAYDLPQTEEEWIAAIGQDNTNALDALVDCQHDRAELLAKAGATSENPDFALAGYWLEALVAVDSKDQATAESLFAELVDLDDDVDTVQQASVAADQAILKIRETRSVEGISCER